jgi:hypothetical protein
MQFKPRFVFLVNASWNGTRLRKGLNARWDEQGGGRISATMTHEDLGNLLTLHLRKHNIIPP